MDFLGYLLYPFLFIGGAAGGILQVLLIAVFYPLLTLGDMAGAVLLMLAGMPWFWITGSKPPFWP